jgi:hypothetical protein
MQSQERDLLVEQSSKTSMLCTMLYGKDSSVEDRGFPPASHFAICAFADARTHLVFVVMPFCRALGHLK